jgi:sugar/nucleoside kinase (ribokinase family)
MVKDPLRVDIEKCAFKALFGTGGIGSGMFFSLNGNHTLGREESRSGHFIDRRDYCKLHIVSHYVKQLLGTDFQTIPIGMVGDDEVGRGLYREMEEIGLDMKFVQVDGDMQTLFSFCFIYPDGSGGNMTTDDSASGRVTPGFIECADKMLAKYSGRGVVLAVPEVPLDARIRLIQLGTEHSLFRVASFTTGEMKIVRQKKILDHVDLLALNIDEAVQVAGGLNTSEDTESAARRAAESLGQLYPQLSLTITAGMRGSWAWNGERISYFPAVGTDVESTAGAGDAFLAGVIAGLTAGITLAEAQQLGTLVGSLSVTSPHTIHKGITRSTLHYLLKNLREEISKGVQTLLE